jgi:tripartite-type tricarboxylate transporter receptor subunit TctC
MSSTSKRVVATALLLVGMCISAAAQSWPQRPVKLIVPLGPGSGVDIGMRMLGERLSKKWGQPVVIENRTGGDAIVAITAFMSANDDHVLLATPTSSITAHPFTAKNLPYKMSDLVPIARGWITLIGIAVPANLEVNSLKELVELARKKPSELNWAGTTGAIDFLFAGFLKKNNLDMARVPYKNPQDATNDLATNRIQVAEASLATLQPQLQAKSIKLLALVSSVRSPSYPDVPTAKEAGFPELTLDGLVGLFGPKDMPLSIREQIAADLREAVLAKDFESRLNLTAQVVAPGGPKELTESFNDQKSRVAGAAKDLGVAASK